MTMCVVVVMLTAINLVSFVVRYNVANEQQRTRTNMCVFVRVYGNTGMYSSRQQHERVVRKRRRSDAYQTFVFGIFDKRVCMCVRLF